MDINHIKAFVEIAREGNLTRAAGRLHLTQPAVSLQIKHLQEFLGVQLFVRGSQGLVLTREGTQLLPLAERALQSVKDVVDLARGMTNQTRGALKIGTILDPDFTRLGLFLKTLVEAYPLVETQLEQLMSGTVYKKVLLGELDVGYYLGDVDSPLLHSQVLTQFVYKVIAPRGWQKRVQGKGWAELAGLPWIWTPAESVHNRLLTGIFAQAGAVPNKVAQVDQEPSMLDMVKSGVGLSLARESVALSESQAHGLAIADQVEVRSSMAFICQSQRYEEPVIKAAFSSLQTVWR